MERAREALSNKKHTGAKMRTNERDRSAPNWREKKAAMMMRALTTTADCATRRRAITSEESFRSRYVLSINEAAIQNNRTHPSRSATTSIARRVISTGRYEFRKSLISSAVRHARATAARSNKK